nr:ATPase, T2SS/T4P/T4SS family [Rhodopirellula sp. JC639]
MVNDCLAAALQRGASDIHIQPRSGRWEVAFRINGVLHPYETFETSDHSDPVSRLMALAALPSYRAGVPQEGPLRWHDGTDQVHEMRLGVFPTVHGNRAVIRIMGDCQSLRRIDGLGFEAAALERLQTVCQARDGWLLVAGPAGSGKTTTLYACLSYIAETGFRRSVLTIEDPIESVIDSISQSQLQPSSGMTLASAMRAAVRQDAEVLLVSEIRDVDTAEAVLAASMTGHLCFSSIHAGSIGATLRRLVQMKLPIYAIQSGLRGILCQRLLRETCPECPPPADSPGNTDCPRCHGTGYQGRVPIAQMLCFDGSAAGQVVFDALAGGRSAMEIDAIAAGAGIDSLHDQAARLVDEGRTGMNEVFRVLGRRR